MKFTNDEKLLALVALLHAPDGSEVPMSSLKLFFDRPGRLAAAAKSMIRWDMASAPAGMNSLRINREKLLTALALKKPVELFSLPTEPGEHAINGNSCASAHKNGESFTPMPKPKPPAPPPKPIENNGFHAVHAHHAMPMPSGSPHVLSCKSESLKKLHGHDVGELELRTTEEMMADIHQLNPTISADHSGQWRERIEREDATLVNGIIRQARLQRRQIKNIGGWMNACYLKGISQK